MNGLDRIGRAVRLLALALAVAGGIGLTAITLITVFSVTGRAFLAYGLGPVPGDFELVEAGTAFAIFAFLPWAHLARGHASVEILTMSFSATANRVIDVIGDALMLLIAVVLTYQHWLGTLDKIAYRETTFILRFPIWWAYAAGLVGAVAFVVIAAFCLVRSLAALKSGQSVSAEGPVH
jgi:TRAP-type C4-dicarboxylate transport system permease small subunit